MKKRIIIIVVCKNADSQMKQVFFVAIKIVIYQFENDDEFFYSKS